VFCFNMEPRLKWNKIIFYFISDMVPRWNKIISDPSHRRRSTFLKFYFTCGSIMKWNKMILAEHGRSSAVCQICVFLAYRRQVSAAGGTWGLQ